MSRISAVSSSAFPSRAWQAVDRPMQRYPGGGFAAAKSSIIGPWNSAGQQPAPGLELRHVAFAVLQQVRHHRVDILNALALLAGLQMEQHHQPHGIPADVVAHGVSMSSCSMVRCECDSRSSSWPLRTSGTGTNAISRLRPLACGQVELHVGISARMTAWWSRFLRGAVL